MNDPAQDVPNNFIVYAKDVENCKREYDAIVRRFIGTSYINDNTVRFQHLYAELDRGYKISMPKSDNLLTEGKGLLWFHLDVYCSISAHPHPKIISEITNILQTLAIEKNIY